jgi:hypothetical protein
VRRMRCEAGGGRGRVFVPSRLASTGRQQCTIEGAELVVCVSFGLPVCRSVRLLLLQMTDGVQTMQVVWWCRQVLQRGSA